MTISLRVVPVPERARHHRPRAGSHAARQPAGTCRVPERIRVARALDSAHGHAARTGGNHAADLA